MCWGSKLLPRVTKLWELQISDVRKSQSIEESRKQKFGEIINNVTRGPQLLIQYTTSENTYTYYGHIFRESRKNMDFVMAVRGYWGSRRLSNTVRTHTDRRGDRMPLPNIKAHEGHDRESLDATLDFLNVPECCFPVSPLWALFCQYTQTAWV